MPKPPNVVPVPDRISSAYSEEFTHLFGEGMKHEDFRKKVQEICDDYVGKVTFMDKVREYAGMEIDSRLFRSSQYWITTILTAVVTSLLAFFLGRYLPK